MAFSIAPRRLWVPGLLFAIFGTATVFGPNLLHRVSVVEGARLYNPLLSGIHTALWLSGAYLLVRLTNLLFWEGIVAHGIGRPVPRLLKDTLGLFVFLIAVAGVVGIEFGQSIVGIWATSGAIGIVLGIALRNIILDIFTGLAVNFDHSYRIGDWVDLFERGFPTIRGKVIEINWRTTRIETEERRVMVVPNSRMGEMLVSNLSMPDDICRFETRITLDFSVPNSRAVRVLLAGARAACGPEGPLTDPAPSVTVVGSSDLGVEYRVRYWHSIATLREGGVRNLVLQSVFRHLTMAGLTPSYPKQDIFRAKMPTRQLEFESIADRTKLLRRIEIFDKLTDTQLAQLGGQIELRYFVGGDELMVQGAEAGTAFIVAEGLCEVSRRDGETLSKIDRIEPGDFVGERSMLTGEPHRATVTALTEVVAFAVHPENFAPILAELPELYEHISHQVALRHMRNERALMTTGDQHAGPEVHSITAQILDGMRTFFHSLGGNRTEAPDASGEDMPRRAPDRATAPPVNSGDPRPRPAPRS
jgi:small-conductance mechanosensitive channel/CRP-like cAMP-binding protein